MRLPLLIALLVAGGLTVATKARPSNESLAAARPQIEALIGASGAEIVGLAVYDTQTEQTLLIKERVSLHAASTMKVPVMMEIFRQAEANKLALDDPIEVQNRFSSIVDGSAYRLTREDDSDEEVYRQIGKKMPVIELINHMITRSSNLATNILIEKVKADNVNQLARELGANEIQVRRGVEDSKAFQAGLNNTTTAYDLMLLLRWIAEERFLNKNACRKMIEILCAQHFNDGIPAGLPAEAKVAHKTGDITKHNHDAGIVYLAGRKPYVIVVLTKGIADQKRSHLLIAEISRAVYLALNH